MGLFSAISSWQTARQEKFVANMHKKNKCPDCYGRGFIAPAGYEYAYPFDCTSCNGSGTFSDWAKNQI
ncbi:hypothetical protein [Heyndrickxia acidiproducens]|uniref:hypothetical protein n=1 Tax=Heyndrickxia acidiproducens TaxID=1121084 RepID=UPI00037772EE|nr:hypothetical protein [Heyndrickxia acidiproducens]